MLSKPISTKVFFAFALAILMAWVGHTSVLFTGSSQSDWSEDKGAHSHHHDDTPVCAICADHYHSSMTADHLHEIPHLTTLLSISTQPELTQPVDELRHSIPPTPVFLIERPPRPIFVL